MEGKNYSWNIEAHVHSATKPPDLSTITTVEPFAKTQTSDMMDMETSDTTETSAITETSDIPTTEAVETFGKAEPLDLPKVENQEPFGKTEPLYFSRIEGAEPLYSPTAKLVKLFGHPLIESTFREYKRKESMLQLSRIRDFIRLLLNYPVRTAHDSKLKAWIREASNRRHSLQDLNRLLTQKPLKCFQGLLPMDILKNVERGWSPIFSYFYMIPKAILNLAANLAVDQLVETLLSEDDHVRNLHHVLLSARDGAEKRLVMQRIQSILKDKEIMLHETFSGVLYINASGYHSKVEVQVRQQITRQLQLPMIEGNDQWLITSIAKEMSRNKYLVLLADGDAKEPLDLRRVGLLGEELAGVVVFITTESSKQANYEITMTMDLNISTNDHLLPWEVFCQTIGNEFDCLCNAIQKFAVRIVEECSGHLLAIVIVARSLKNVKDVRLWESALFKLRCPHLDTNKSALYGQSRVMVNAFVYFVWYKISIKQKYCVTCCLFIPNIKDGKLERELINDWISSRLVVVGEAEHHLRELLDCFVLLQLKDAKSSYIQMPEDIYSILQSLNTQNPFFMKKVGLGLVEPPNSELWHSAVYIDLADNKLSELPLSPNCLKLKILMLHNNVDLTKLPSLFFSKMPTLCVLDLSYTSVRELPNSFFELEQLKKLYMKSCECFMKLPSEVGRLKRLEELDLDETQIIHLPKEIQELSNLQSLTLCFYEHRGKKSKQYTSSTIVPFGVISKLKQIKHLSIDVNPDDERWKENVQVILPEILALKCLQTVNLYIPEPELLNVISDHFLMLDFRLIIGQHMSRIISGSPSRAEEKFKQSKCSLKFVKGVDAPYEIRNVVRYSKALFLDRHMTIRDLSIFGLMNIEQLQVCILAECKEMQTIVDGRCSSSMDIFPHLLLLSISYMKNLRSICEGQVHSSHCFGMLKYLSLYNCPKLTTIFTLDFLGNLSLLKVLIVKDCPRISAIIACQSSKSKAGTFLPKLRTMTLLHLPELTSISNGLHIGSSLENIGIYDCPKLKSFSKMELSSQNLKVIKAETKWWHALDWREVEWGKVGRPSKFDDIFSEIDEQADIMSQLETDDDIDGGPGGIVVEPLQPSSVKVLKDRRQTYKEERKSVTAWTKESGSFEDGCSWRKYGQEVILGAKFPRNYFKCTDKYEQSCQAIKEVQRIQEEPALYSITYYGSHTCGQKLKPEKSCPVSSKILGFRTTLPMVHDNPLFLSPFSPVSKTGRDFLCSPEDYSLFSEIQF